MKIKRTYPRRSVKKLRRADLISVARWPFLFAAYICPIVNLCVGGRAWSIVVLWSLLIVWTSVLSPDMVDYNPISQLVKLITQCCVLLVLINLTLSPGLIGKAVPIVCFSGLIAVGALFLLDSGRRHNILPMLLMAFVSLLASILGLALLREASRWALTVMGALSLALLLVCICVFGRDMLRELKKLFYTR